MAVLGFGLTIIATFLVAQGAWIRIVVALFSSIWASKLS